MAFIDDIRSELQITTGDISDADLTYVIGKTGEDINLACAYTLRLIVNKYKGRTELEIGTYREAVDIKSLMNLSKSYMTKASVTGYGEIEDSDNIFTMSGI